MIVINENLFWNKVNKTNTCWVWLAYKNNKGYGQFGVRINKKIKMHGAHRVSWQIHFGEIPKGLLVCHKYDNTSCVNPKHLFLGTNQDNMNDRNKKGRQAKGEKIHTAVNTQKEINKIRLLYQQGCSQKFLIRKFGICSSQICRIVNYKIWK